MLNLGYLYAVGQGVEQDYSQARGWYILAAKAGDKSAVANLKSMDARNLGLPAKTPSLWSKATVKPNPITPTPPVTVATTNLPKVISPKPVDIAPKTVKPVTRTTKAVAARDIVEPINKHKSAEILARTEIKAPSKPLKVRKIAEVQYPTEIKEHTEIKELSKVVKQTVVSQPTPETKRPLFEIVKEVETAELVKKPVDTKNVITNNSTAKSVPTLNTVQVASANGLPKLPQSQSDLKMPLPLILIFLVICLLLLFPWLKKNYGERRMKEKFIWMFLHEREKHLKDAFGYYSNDGLIPLERKGSWDKTISNLVTEYSAELSLTKRTGSKYARRIMDSQTDFPSENQVEPVSLVDILNKKISKKVAQKKI